MCSILYDTFPLGFWRTEIISNRMSRKLPPCFRPVARFTHNRCLHIVLLTVLQGITKNSVAPSSDGRLINSNTKNLPTNALKNPLRLRLGTQRISNSKVGSHQLS
ncbi:hypothetical protein CEXT_34371 [Caerostris extrusa]|uniref:Uncharacterized protein n=1 Tax=Caerostris extrusa TaxID=172846 RepID=A0AAV4PIV8_CAEEX|nr:hypothetical protein CEXT_34371 [Caerostris extrusa]